MKADILASGSNGNCIAIQNNDSCILIDAGIAKTKIEKRLLDVGIRPDTVKAILITHAHKDHCKGLPLANKYKIPVYAAEREWESITGVDEDNKKSFEPYKQFELENFNIVAFSVYHDAKEPVGYVVTDLETEETCSVCLDTGIVSDRMLDAMRGSDIYIIESNHELKMVEASSYPNSVKARILSDLGHLSNVQAAKALYHLVQGKGEKIFLTHLSQKNNLPDLAKFTVIKVLSTKGLKPERNFYIEVI